MRYGLGLLFLLVLGAMTVFRFAPSDPEIWHITLDAERNVDRKGSATRVMQADVAVFAKADAHMRGLPRTKVIAGSLEERHITYVTRSLLWGFPDYTTLQYSETDGVLRAFARLRFGKSDLGVNAERLEGLFAALK